MHKLIFVFLCLLKISPVFAFESTLQKIKATKELKICSESGYLPLEMRTASGTWLGFDVDMMEAFSKSLGVKLVMLDTKWDGIIPSLVSGKCDGISSSMAITKEREKAVAFSTPYYENKFLIASRSTPENFSRFKKLSDFNSPSITIAVKTGSSPDLFVQTSNMFKQAKIIRFDADSDTVNAILNNKADAFIYDTPYVKLTSLHYAGKLFVFPVGFNGDDFGVAFRKQDHDLLQSFNEFLANWKRQGGYNNALRYYFETTKWTALVGN